MTNGFKSLWDVEQEAAGIKKCRDRIVNVVGRETKLPRKLKGRNVSVEYISDPEEVLKEMGYTKFFDNGWIKTKDKNSRYHANVTQDRKDIYIHIDMGSPTNKRRHIATSEGVETEMVMAREIIRKRKPIMMPKYIVHPETLSHEQQLAALEKLRGELREKRLKESWGKSIIEKVIHFFKA